MESVGSRDELLFFFSLFFLQLKYPSCKEGEVAPPSHSLLEALLKVLLSEERRGQDTKRQADPD
jgi:hypothetical protein